MSYRGSRSWCPDCSGFATRIQPEASAEDTQRTRHLMPGVPTLIGSAPYRQAYYQSDTAPCNRGPVRLSPNTDVKIGGRTDQIKAVSLTPVVGLVRAHLRVQPCVKRRGRAQLMAGQLATAALRTAVVLALLTHSLTIPWYNIHNIIFLILFLKVNYQGI